MNEPSVEDLLLQTPPVKPSLAECLKASIKGDTFDSKNFFDLWFKRPRGAYYFLFKKNLRVTNLQLVELLSLIRCHTKTASEKDLRRRLNFVSVAEFKESIVRLLFSFRTDERDLTSCCDLVNEMYADLVNTLIVVDCFWGSCAVFLPPTITIDLTSICGYSGYVHSCGRNIFIRNFRKLQRSEFEKELEKYLAEQTAGGKRIRLIVYGHEDFSIKDEEQAGYLRDGLHDVKLYIEKYYMGSETLVDALKKLQERFADRIEIPGPDFYDPSPEAEWKPEDKDLVTLWLVADHGIAPRLRQKSDEQYFICYEQAYLNRNPTHWFEENKPAWVDHTTLPHTLAGAMLNVTRPWWPEDGVVVADPFIGTGTTAFEAAKYPQATVICSDELEIVETVVGDNFRFFSSDYESLKATELTLANLGNYGLRRPRKGASAPEDPVRIFQDDHNWAMDMLDELLPDPASSVLRISADSAKRINENRFSARLLLYLALRADRRHFAAIERGGASWDKAFFMEAEELRKQVAQLRALRSQKPVREVDQIQVFEGAFSQRCVADTRTERFLTETGNLRVHVKCRLARDFKPEMPCDVIITDPPYGFNTDEDRRKLADLYSVIIPLMIKALKPEGQLIFAVPDWSHTGREVPFFVLKEIIIRQVLTAAEHDQREVIVPAHSAPPQGDLFRPPYFWESAKALRRAILHFHFRPKGARA